uniref:Uncharacterized protein n=1 Tax=Chromera velia CCMP2878 TaxID=1169474 RepID=A0A0G4F418_9ALVE|eukprot:Cvel_15051.t1-p1 / transcript=Cvel_15051.t1 / gene=Cvel_15051 / organism=Chromera_velia_CCMP2878 / gene_product=hypothetical protein / transcript_product=hypothetical protein / location=Cvel_scaffold1096:12530-16212(-) / protein_length=521 / sequence_SO=supercontig / SO=protein_coding / is_pseudo=false
MRRQALVFLCAFGTANAIVDFSKANPSMMKSEMKMKDKTMTNEEIRNICETCVVPISMSLSQTASKENPLDVDTCTQILGPGKASQRNIAAVETICENIQTTVGTGDLSGAFEDLSYVLAEANVKLLAQDELCGQFENGIISLATTGLLTFSAYLRNQCSVPIVEFLSSIQCAQGALDKLLMLVNGEGGQCIQMFSPAGEQQTVGLTTNYECQDDAAASGAICAAIDADPTLATELNAKLAKVETLVRSDAIPEGDTQEVDFVDACDGTPDLALAENVLTSLAELVKRETFVLDCTLNYGIPLELDIEAIEDAISNVRRRLQSTPPGSGTFISDVIAMIGLGSGGFTPASSPYGSMVCVDPTFTAIIGLLIGGFGFSGEISGEVNGVITPVGGDSAQSTLNGMIQNGELDGEGGFIGLLLGIGVGFNLFPSKSLAAVCARVTPVAESIETASKLGEQLQQTCTQKALQALLKGSKGYQSEKVVDQKTQIAEDKAGALGFDPSKFAEGLKFDGLFKDGVFKG